MRVSTSGGGTFFNRHYGDFCTGGDRTLVGTPVSLGDGNGAKGSAIGLPRELPANRNTITWREDRNSRDFEASLSDASMQTVGGFFGELFANRVGRAMQPSINRLFTHEGATAEIARPQLPPAMPEQQQAQSQQPTENIPKGDPAKDRLLKIFSVTGQTIELSDNRLKAKSAADSYKRLTYVFLYAQEVLLGRTATPRTELNPALHAAKVNNGNCRAWLGKKNGFTVDGEDKMKLVSGAREQAIKVVDDILDSNLVDEWHPDTRKTRSRGPSKKKGA